MLTTIYSEGSIFEQLLGEKMTQNITHISKAKSYLLTRAEAAEYLGVTAQTLAVWACTQRYNLPVVKIGRLAKYKLSDLDAFINNRLVGGAAA